MGCSVDDLKISVLEKEKLSGNNFLGWYRNLRIVLTQENKLYALEQAFLAPSPDNATRVERDAYSKHQDDAMNIGCLMLATVDLEFQKQHENMGAYDMIVHLRQLYQDYSQFVMNYNLSEYNKPLSELLSMLRTAEQNTNKGMHVLMVQGTKEKGKDKKKGKKVEGASKYDSGALKPKANVAKDDYCFRCGNTRHWKRNCRVYLEELRKNKGNETSTSSIHVIKINVSIDSTY
ncbi:hypothetical protein CRG98_020030 [Punica granatum]|uniref:CCHC-type domain-containing protein n=1 Tax=Punica granatum TaxID=22663 RepID=A0A2I0JTM2_PUNGR|nr:hypothetical protein CRG98_020030 [Punica granatum]